jgi:hypothetical protein
MRALLVVLMLLVGCVDDPDTPIEHVDYITFTQQGVFREYIDAPFVAGECAFDVLGDNPPLHEEVICWAYGPTGRAKRVSKGSCTWYHPRQHWAVDYCDDCPISAITDPP